MFPYTEVPVELQALPNWVGWKSEPTSDTNSKLTKRPYDINNNGRESWAKTTDPTTWTTFQRAVEATDPLNGNDYNGIGLVFTDDLQGADLDGAVETINSTLVINPFALSIAKLVRSYSEFSQSQTGLHLIWKSPVPLPEGHKKGNHKMGGEIYDKASPRYFATTGDKIPTLSTDSLRTITDPNTIKLIHFLVLNHVEANDKLIRLWTGAWQKTTDAQGRPFPSQSEADLALCHILVRGGFNTTETLDAAFRQSGLMRDEWNHKSKYTIAKALSGQEEIASSQKSTKPTTVKPTAAITFRVAAVPDPDNEYVLAPADGQEDGWFPLGDISLVGGASGTGKTTWLSELLHKQKQGWPVLDHRTFGRLFHILAYDRRKNAFSRTLRRMHLLSTDMPTTPMPTAMGTAAVQAIIDEIEKMNPRPAVVVLEGLDMLVDEANKKSVVVPFMRHLQEVAEHFHIALIGSVGAPKTKRGEDYAAKRDKISGSEAWGRNCETVAVLEFSEEGDGTAPQRELTVLPRNADAEKFSLQFEHGRLVRIEPTTQEAAGRKLRQGPEIAWFQEQAELAKTDPRKKWWTVRDLELGLDIPYLKAWRWVTNAHKKHYLVEQRGGAKTTKKDAGPYRWNDSPENPLWVEIPQDLVEVADFDFHVKERPDERT